MKQWAENSSVETRSVVHEGVADELGLMQILRIHHELHYLAPVVRNAQDGVRELAMLRWGMPGPPQFGGAPVTNIRNAKSPHWRAWLTPEHRCVVPWTSFCELAVTKPRKTPTWFAFNDERPVAVFAGIWTTWRG